MDNYEEANYYGSEIIYYKVKRKFFWKEYFKNYKAFIKNYKLY